MLLLFLVTLVANIALVALSFLGFWFVERGMQMPNRIEIEIRVFESLCLGMGATVVGSLIVASIGISEFIASTLVLAVVSMTFAWSIILVMLGIDLLLNILKSNWPRS